MSQRINLKPFLLLILGLAGVLTILYSTRWGIAIHEDSFWYVSGAESLLRGHGFSHITHETSEVRAITHWPPLFPLTLASFGLAGISILDGVRWFHALIFGANIVLVGYVVYKNTDFWHSVFASSLILTSINLIKVHSYAQSEPLYIFLGLCGLLFLDNHLKKSEIHHLILSALFIGAATLTRYLGVTLIATLCISVLVFSKRPWRQRLVDCFIAGLISSLPLLLWIVRNRLVSGRTSDMDLLFHLVTVEHIKVGWHTISVWFPVPQRIPSSLRPLAIPAVGLVVLVIAWWRRSSAPRISYLHGLYVLVYFLGLAFFISIVSIGISFDARYLAPMFVSVVIILSCYKHQLTLQGWLPVRIAITVLCVLFFLGPVRIAIAEVKRVHQQGWHFEGPYWTQMGLMNTVNNLPSGTRIYSNCYIPVGFLTHRDVKPFPYKFGEHTGSTTSDYLQQLQAIGTTSKSQRTVIIYLKIQNLPYFPTEDELRQILSLREIERTPDGSIYEVLG